MQFLTWTILPQRCHSYLNLVLLLLPLFISLSQNLEVPPQPSHHKVPSPYLIDVLIAFVLDWVPSGL